MADFLHITKRDRDGITILDLDGRLTLGAEDLELRESLLGLLAHGERKVILNFQHVTDIDTSSIGTLIHCAKKYEQAKGRIAFLNLTGAHAEIPEILKLNTVFETYQDEADAVNSFFPDRVVPHYDILEFVERMEKEHVH